MVKYALEQHRIEILQPESSMSSILQQIIAMRTPFNMIVLVVIVSCGAGLVTSLAKQCRKYACHRQELDFKRDLLDRGMAIDEIERLVRARHEEPRIS